MNDINKIRKENIEDIMDLTDTQKGMLYHYIKDSDTKEYQEQTCITIAGEIDIEVFKKAWNYVIETNEMLRTVYKWDKLDNPVQIVLKNYEVPFKFVDLSKESNEVNDELFKEILENHKNENIDITNESIKITICKIKEYMCKMIIKNHHILYDGWSNGIILREFIEAYNCYFQGEEPIKLVKNKFKQLIKWNKQQDKSRQKEYWQSYLKDFEHESNIFSSNNISKMHRHIDEHTYIISDLTKNKLELCAKKLQVSVSAILYSVWSILQQRYENTEDVVFGMTVSGRTAKIKGIDNIVGMFINTIPLRVKADNNQKASSLIKSVEEYLRSHEEFENTSLSDIKSYGKYNHEKSLFDNIVVIENYPLDKVGDKNSKIKIEDCSISETTNFNMTFAISIFDDLEIKVSYNKELFEDEFIIRMTKHYENILNEISSNASINISKIEMISEEEKNRILYNFNDTYTNYPRDKTIHELFEEQVEKTPDNVALVFEDKELTYKELNEKSNKLARTLRGKGVKVDSIVGVMVERSIEMIVGIIGILKSGGAYLPIDPGYPKDRIKYMMEDSKVEILLIKSKLKEEGSYEVELLDLEDEKCYEGIDENLDVVNCSKDLAYVIYTSGSTGKPKGVMIEHKNVLSLIFSLNNNVYSNYGSNLNIALVAPYVFDASVQQIFPSVLLGHKLFIVSEETRKSGDLLLEYYINNLIDISDGTPVHMNMLSNARYKENTRLNVKCFIIGGDVLLCETVRKFLYKFGETKTNIVNIYGPTECCVDSISYNIDINKIKDLETIPIGKPMCNEYIYILGKNLEILPLGVVGEIYIAGEGVGRGYLNRLELTSEKFINSPFVSGQRMYKTGDLARWMPDGNIEFLGRIDHQVKIRGFRIELGEIESQLLNYETVKEAIVLAREDENGAKYLCAYLISQKELTIGELREHLSKNLSEYMIPSYFVQLDKMPITKNGKIDRKALPKPDERIVAGTEYEAARNEVEEKLVTIWKDVLGVKKVGINDNFFELGGHSLKATTLVSKIHKELKVEVPLREIFTFPTIKGTSKYMESLEKSIYESIEIVEEKEYYEASSAQKRMYMLQQVDLGSTVYNMPGVMVIEGKLNVEKLEKCFSELIRRHETLRTSFETIDEKIVQKVNESVNFKLDCFEVDCIESKDKVVDHIVKDFVQAFDLKKAPLLRVGLIKSEEEKYILMFDMHHIISDGVSMGILTNEFAKIYEGIKLEQLKIQYKDYSQWQNSLLKSEVIAEQKEYWINRFSDQIPVLNMPTDFQRPLMQSFEGENIIFKLDKELTRNLKQISKETGSTMYMVLLSGVNILLSKYSGQEDIIVGSPIAGRPHADLEKIIGMFVNTLAMRNYPDGSKTYEDFLTEVKENALKAYENQDYQFDDLVDKLSIPRDISRNPLFDVIFTMQNFDSEDIELKDLVFKGYKQEDKVAKFDLTFSASEVKEEVIFELQYSTKLYKTETMERMVEHFINIFKSVATDTKIKLSEIDMLTEGEKSKLLYEFNDTYADYPRDKTIHQLFEEQVENTPDSIAVVFEGKKLTYRELNEKSNRLARNLREKGVKSDSIVGIMVERSFEMIVGIIGILKSGGAYLPIDPEYPEDRIKYILDDSKTNIILTQNNLVKKIAFEGEIIDLADKKSYVQDQTNLRNINVTKDLAYIIYTSGTTGKPKGAMIEHRNVVRLMFNERMQFDFNEKDVWTMFHSYCFDFSVWEMYGALLYGGKLVLISKNTARDTEEYLKVLKKERVTILNQIPTPFYNLMNKELNCSTEDLKLRYIIFGGEALKPEMLNQWIKKYSEIKLINMYGITETTVHVTYKEIGKKEINQKISNIGMPIPTLSTYIMDKNLKLQPIGVPGELCVGGEGVGRGYLNNKELSEEKFVFNTYKPEEKIYRSGDLARILVNGELEYLGRIDNQVKIRGFRIELGEIESQLLNHELVKEAIVIDREDENGTKYLCAYLISEKELTVGELRYYISKNLPEYMIPSYFVQLDKMPLTPNGKIDRKSLPKPDGSILIGTEYKAPRNKVEERLIAIWNEVLGVEKVGINDNFFELGGHSLKATTLVSRIHKELNVEVPLREIFRFPTIRGINQYIESTESRIYSSIEIAEDKEYYKVSSAQKRMYMLQQFDLKSTVYNMPGVMMVKGRLEVDRIEKSFAKLIRRHETLRTSFETREDRIVQRVSERVNFKLNRYEVGCIESQDKAVDNIVKDFVKAFDLNKAPLLRVGLIKLEEDNHILMFDMHHIISDGVSMGILINEFAKIYEGNKLEQIRIQYKDYSQWQDSLLNSDVMQEQKEYWINKFKDEIPVLNMPTDYIRPKLQSFEGENINFKLDKKLTKDLIRISQETGSTMYMILLSNINILLSKYSGQEDIIVGSPIAGRPHADLEKIIGIFVNTLAMRNHPEANKTYEDFLSEVKENALNAYENQDYQFDELVDNLSIPRDISRNPVFDVMFTMQNMDLDDIELKDLIFKGYKEKHNVAKFDLTFSASEVKQEVIFELQYSTKLYKRETIERMVEHFINIIKVVTADIKIKLSEIEMLTEDEKHKLLYEFNDSYVEYPRDKTIHELFEEQVEYTPDNVAIVFEDKKLTYRELNERSNSLARKLREKGVKPDSIVGIMVERSFEMIVGIIGVLKAGGAYLPIDPGYPEDRIRYMLQHSGTEVLLAQRKFIKKINFSGDTIELDNEKIYVQSRENLKNVNNSKNLAYLIYTSGSTGMPKGVMVEHKTIINTLLWRIKYYEFNSEDAVLQIPSFSFDSSVEDIFTPLLSGAKLILILHDRKLNLQYIKTCIEKNNVGYMLLVPSFYRTMLKEIGNSLENMKGITVAGENFAKELAIEHYEKLNNVHIYNEYGPTENSVCTSAYKVDKDNINTLIGKPINNVKCYILSKNNKLQPIGVEGELCISGEGLARGYFNRAELTREKFTANLFAFGERMYKTGDLARWLPDGNIEFRGRVDHQVKIRGFRIELGEIESNLLTHEAVMDAVAIDRDDQGGNKNICAYLVSDQQITVGELREHLLKKLPEYMVPSYFIQIDKIPLTPNGKIDRKALPEPNGIIVTGREYEAPQNDVEEKLAIVWSEVLGAEKVGIKDNFFELGGDSIKGIQVLSRIKRYGLTLEMKELFRNPTIEMLSRYVENLSVQAEQGNIEGEIELAPIQKWFFEQNFTDMHHWNQAIMLYNETGFDKNITQRVFDKICVHHDLLRTVYEETQEGIRQVNRGIEAAAYSLEVFDFRNRKEYEKEITEICSNIQGSIDLRKGPLMKLGIFKTDEGDHLLIVIHHLIVDGISWRILLEDLSTGYKKILKNEEIKLQEKTFSYRGWTESLKKYAEDWNLLKELEYWKQIELNEIKPFKKDFEVVKNTRECLKIITLSLDKEKTEKLLKEVNKAYNTEINDILLTTLGLAIKKWSGEIKVCVNVEGHGRENVLQDVDVTRTIGWFTSHYPVVLDMVKSEEISYVIKETKETLRHIPNKGIGYSILKYLTNSNLKGNIELKLNPEINFNYLGQLDEDISTSLFEISSLSVGNSISIYSEILHSIDINGIIVDGRLNMTFLYNEKEYKESTIRHLANEYMEQLQSIILHCLNKQKSELTPWDLGSEEITIQELEEYMLEIGSLVNSTN